MNKIETSTTCINSRVYQGTYETYLGEHLGGVPYDMRDEVDAEIGKIYLDILTNALAIVFNGFDVDDDFSVEYVNTYHPRYYNFETDAIVFNFEYSDRLRDWMLDYAMANNERFKNFLVDNFTSRDGFYSFTPNNWADWKDGWDENDWRCVSVLIWFILEWELLDEEVKSYWYDFNEQAEELICENYTPWEWAERFDNGFVAVVRGDWDDDAQATIYNAYLINKSGKVINHAGLSDEYDEDFHQSAFAAFIYSNLVSDMMGGYESSIPCDVPEFDAD